MTDFELGKVRTAVNIVTGDDGHQSAEVLEVLQALLNMEEWQYKEQVKFYG